MRFGSITELDRAERLAMLPNPLDIDAENTSSFLARQQAMSSWPLLITQGLDHLAGNQLGVAAITLTFHE